MQTRIRTCSLPDECEGDKRDVQECPIIGNCTSKLIGMIWSLELKLFQIHISLKMTIDKLISEGSGYSVDLRGENDQADCEYCDGTEGSGLPPCDISGKAKYIFRELQCYY